MKLHKIKEVFLATSEAMPRSLKIEIKESTQQLEKQVKTARTAGTLLKAIRIWTQKTFSSLSMRSPGNSEMS